MKILNFKNKELVQKEAGKRLDYLIKKFNSKPLLLLLSGGSVLDLLKNIKEESLGSQVNISALDERFSEDREVNNFSQIMQTSFYDKALRKNCKFIDTRVIENDGRNSESNNITSDLTKQDKKIAIKKRFSTPDELACFWEIEFRKWKAKNSQGKVLAILGIGKDGHTAGIMPFPESNQRFAELFEQDNWVTSYDAKSKNQYPLRVTTTVTFLKNKIDKALVFAASENKKRALEKVFAQEGTLPETPARVIRDMKNVEVFTP